MCQYRYTEAVSKLIFKPFDNTEVFIFKMFYRRWYSLCTQDASWKRRYLIRHSIREEDSRIAWYRILWFDVSTRYRIGSQASYLLPQFPTYYPNPRIILALILEFQSKEKVFILVYNPHTHFETWIKIHFSFKVQFKKRHTQQLPIAQGLRNKTVV